MILFHFLIFSNNLTKFNVLEMLIEHIFSKNYYLIAFLASFQLSRNSQNQWEFQQRTCQVINNRKKVTAVKVSLSFAVDIAHISNSSAMKNSLTLTWTDIRNKVGFTSLHSGLRPNFPHHYVVCFNFKYDWRDLQFKAYSER